MTIMEKPAKKKAQKNIIFKADSPYTSPKWPIIEPTEQDNILNLLCQYVDSSPRTWITLHRKDENVYICYVVGCPCNVLLGSVV
jgi:hypothetical protein